MSGSKDDYGTLVSYYLSTANPLQGFKDLSIAGMAVAALLILVGGQSVMLWLLPFAAYLALAGVEKALGIEVRTRLDASQNGWEPDIVDQEVTESDLDGEASAECVETGDSHSTTGELRRTYQVFYVLGYEVYRSLQTENFYCGYHRQANEEPIEESVDEVEETVTTA